MVSQNQYCLASLLICVCSYFAGCATIISGNEQSVTITSEPLGAKVHVDPIGVSVVTPAELKLDRRLDYLVTIELEGFQKARARINRTVNPATYAQAWQPYVGIVGLYADAKSGAEFSLFPDPLHVVLQKASAIPVAKAKLSGSRQITFFNSNKYFSSSVYFRLDNGEECRLKSGEYVIRELVPGDYDFYVYHLDMFKFDDSYVLSIDESTTHVGVFGGIFSTHYSFYEGFPEWQSEFRESDCKLPEPKPKKSSKRPRF